MTAAERALQIWQVLIGAAHNRQTLIYEMLGELIGMGPPYVTLRHPLDRVAAHCREHGLPPLTVLAVGKHTGCPGPGYIPESDTDADRERVFNESWYRLAPPGLADFEV